ncbi:MAG: patatin-like phospholipase family protein [Burkholderiaceae bacterium]
MHTRSWFTGTLAAASLCLVGCATVFDNAPLNRPITQQFVDQAILPRDIVGTNTIGLSLSGGGMRAAAFAYGVLQALAGEAGGTDVFDDLTFMSSVSGGSLTAAYFALHGRKGFDTYRATVLERNLERDLRMSLWSPTNLSRLLAGGLNDRSNLARTLDEEIFKGATFADLYRNNKPDVWINASDLYNRTPFPFIPPVFMGLCSDLTQFRVAEAVAASMAVPLVFKPIALKTFPDSCLSSMPDWAVRAPERRAEQGIVSAIAQSIRNYRDPQRMQYVKLVDGGLTDNYGLSSILVARAVSGTPYGPINEADAIRVRRMLFLIVDAGRPPTGDWAKELNGPSAVDVGLAAADTAIDAAARLAVDAFRIMIEDWQNSVVRFRCTQPRERIARFLPADQEWRCDDVQFVVGVVGFDDLEPARAERLKNMPTRLSLPKAEIEDAIQAGRDATLANPALRAYLATRIRGVSTNDRSR